MNPRSTPHARHLRQRIAVMRKHAQRGDTAPTRAASLHCLRVAQRDLRISLRRKPTQPRD